jgi:hypothetical protein
MTNGNKELIDVVWEALLKLEQENEIVICSASAQKAAQKIASELGYVVPDIGLTATEMYGVRLLILNAIADKRFFDWEMPTLTGFTSQQFMEIAEKLPRE